MTKYKAARECSLNNFGCAVSLSLPSSLQRFPFPNPPGRIQSTNLMALPRSHDSFQVAKDLVESEISLLLLQQPLIQIVRFASECSASASLEINVVFGSNLVIISLLGFPRRPPVPGLNLAPTTARIIYICSTKICTISSIANIVG